MGVQNHKDGRGPRRADALPADPAVASAIRREEEEREQRVEALRQRYLAGDYSVDAEALARRIVESDLLNELADLES